jgi:hypothetical protein
MRCDVLLLIETSERVEIGDPTPPLASPRHRAT